MEKYEKLNRIKEALELRNMRPYELCQLSGVSKTSLSNWMKQIRQPKQTALFNMARALEVSEMWLAGYDCPMERPVSLRKIDSLHDVMIVLRNNEKYYNVVCDYLTLDDEKRYLIDTMITQLKDK